MSTIVARINIACPLASAARHLEQYFAVHQQADGTHAVIDLSVNSTLKHSVIVKMQRKHVAGEMTPHYSVGWTPQGGGPFPDFAGELAIEADDDYNSCFLQLDGSYEPPLGLPGKMFDAMLGKTIAQSTGDHLLQTIRDFIEHDFRLEEARKIAG